MKHTVTIHKDSDLPSDFVPEINTIFQVVQGEKDGDYLRTGDVYLVVENRKGKHQLGIINLQDAARNYYWDESLEEEWYNSDIDVLDPGETVTITIGGDISE